jgi:small conductance mechanosensitive channel
VEALTLRSTQVRAADGTLWTVPNGAILRIGNQSRSWSQASIDVMVGLDADLDRVAEIAGSAAVAAVAEPPFADVVLREPQVLGVERVDQTGAVLRLTVRTKPGHQVAAARHVRAAVKRALDDEGVTYHPPT